MSKIDDAYAAAGVNYDRLDTFKVACQRAAVATRDQLAGHGMTEPSGVRGESAYLIDAGDHYLVHVEEGLGTKNLVADAMAKLTGETYYEAVAIDVVATIVNDLITCGGLPLSVAMHAAVGDSEWFADAARAEALARGFARACVEAGAVWGGGETPTLRGVIEPAAICLAGSAVGRVWPKENRIASAPNDGDAIVFLASSGVQTNGLTLCRKIVDALPETYLTKTVDGRPIGAALLEPSVIYVKFVRACQKAGVKLHYVAHVTGHGWRKLMRPDAALVYTIDTVRQPLPVFEFLCRHGSLSNEQAYATFNMGVGFAAYVSPADADEVVGVATAQGYEAWVAGRVSHDGGRKAVEIPALGIVYDEESLAAAPMTDWRRGRYLKFTPDAPSARCERYPMSSPRYQLHRIGAVGVVELTLPATIEAEEFDELNAGLAELLSVPVGGRWVIDLQKVAYSGSAVLGMLINVRSRVRASKGTLVFCCLDHQLHNILRASSMEKLFNFAPTRAEAVAWHGRA